MGHAHPIPANDEMEDDGRRASRSRVFIAAFVQNAFGLHPVTVRDISSVGAMLDAATVPPVGSRLLFVRGEVSVPAIVVWAAGRRFGLAFQSRIDPGEMLVQIGSSAAPTSPSLSALFPTP